MSDSQLEKRLDLALETVGHAVPVVLRTVDDVAAVCQTVGLVEAPIAGVMDPGAGRRWIGAGIQIDADRRGWTYGVSQNPWPRFPAPTATLLAVIRDAEGRTT